MKLIVWIFRILIFVIVLLFALKNTGSVSVEFFAGKKFNHVPLIVVILVAFGFGALFTYLLAIPRNFKRAREVGRLKGEVKSCNNRLEQLNKDILSTNEELVTEQAKNAKLNVAIKNNQAQLN